jgi:hypothetical protein
MSADEYTSIRHRYVSRFRVSYDREPREEDLSAGKIPSLAPLRMENLDLYIRRHAAGLHIRSGLPLPESVVLQQG